MTALSSAAVLHARIKHIMSLKEIKQTCTHIFSSKKETESIQNHHTTTITQRTHIIAQTQYNVCRVNCRVHNPKEHSCLDINIAVESLSRPLLYNEAELQTIFIPKLQELKQQERGHHRPTLI